MSEAPPIDGSAGTRARIVAVAARLLQEHGAGAVTTRGVAEGAGVQAPAIYRLFGDKDGLLDAVAEHAMVTYVSAKTAARTATGEGVDPLVDLHAGWDMQIEFGLANPALFALLSVPGRLLHSAAARSGMDVLRSRVHRLALAERLRVSEQRAVDLIQAAGTGAVLTLLSTPPDQRDPDLAEAMYQAVLAQILTTQSDQPAGGPVAAAVTLRAHAPDLEILTDAERQLLTEWLSRIIEKLQTAAARQNPPPQQPTPGTPVEASGPTTGNR